MNLEVIRTNSFATAHWKLIRAILGRGVEIPTDYDYPGEPPSLDLTAAIQVTKPWNPPVFSKCVYDSAEGLFEYKNELLYGIHDGFVDKMGYTYHQRYVGQIDGVQKELERNPYTRRAQYIIWRPGEDLGDMYPPCHQRGWFRVINGKLEMHTTWRSRDVYKAWGSNVFAFAHLHRLMAKALGVPVGPYIEFIDSAHIYGRDIETVRNLADRPCSDWKWRLDQIEKEAGVNDA
jgi:hypothetical protein